MSKWRKVRVVLQSAICNWQFAVSLLLLFSLGASAGCSTDAAAIQLIQTGRDGLHLAQQSQREQHQIIAAYLDSQRSALDAAFDADVRLAAAGQIKRPDGSAVEMTPQWVIDARKGYAAARDALADQARLQQTAHDAAMDNIAAADEALTLAEQLLQARSAAFRRLPVTGFRGLSPNDPSTNDQRSQAPRQ
jgi:hypothetical protein